jgi:hypothetical protein
MGRQDFRELEEHLDGCSLSRVPEEATRNVMTTPRSVVPNKDAASYHRRNGVGIAAGSGKRGIEASTAMAS